MTTSTDLRTRGLLADVGLIRALGSGWDVTDLPRRAALTMPEHPMQRRTFLLTSLLPTLLAGIGGRLRQTGGENLPL